MENQQKTDNTVLAHWVYSKEEWRRFLRWRSAKKGFLYALLQKMRLLRATKAGEVEITPCTVTITKSRKQFADTNGYPDKINIYDAGKLNVMEIHFRTGNRSREIDIPVPKGKLKDAIRLQEQLSSH